MCFDHKYYIDINLIIDLIIKYLIINQIIDW